ncbi:unnamed protein product [Strongylus vulgaris]|uniref:Uncharacterized protein n=1 Tax=Strongylus vulgaris TaxID=40348 RepID=A0A3P7KIM8_STRVU|nr:unnamed protein product [Strongylus vulgaris]
MVHGLLFLPVLLIIIIPEKRERQGKRVQDKPKAIFTCDSQSELKKKDIFESRNSYSVEHIANDRKVSSIVEIPVAQAKDEPSDEDVVKATVDRLTGKVLTPEDQSQV